MEKTKEEIAGTRQTNLKTAFELGIHTLLTSCSKEAFCKAFPNFAPAEVERLHRLFIQVITSLHEDIEDEFESLCVETQAGSTLNMVEQLVEEQNLDPLFPEKYAYSHSDNCIARIKMVFVTTQLFRQKLSGIPLFSVLVAPRAEEQKRSITSRLEILKKERHDFSDAAATDIVNKIRTGNQKYNTNNNIGFNS
uniref:Uncharacterized protein n=1 Tax=Solanum tuberosum TaxID=4113 RepID=M1CUY0_SOLTU